MEEGKRKERRGGGEGRTGDEKRGEERRVEERRGKTLIYGSRATGQGL